MSKYINPYTDFGFKKIFGQEASKPLLIDFLNTLLPSHHRVSDISFTNPENLGATADDRKSVFDIFCKNANGERFIVEMQKAEQEYFKDRTVFYSTFPIREQALKGNWSYELKAVYCIGILDFKFQDYPENSAERSEVIHTVELKDQNNQVFYDKLKFIYLEMPNFNKSEAELETHLDKWLYFIKHLDDFESMPHIFKDDALFTQALETAEIAKFNPQELNAYEYSLRIFRDNYSVFITAARKAEAAVRTAQARGEAIGTSKSLVRVARTMKANGLDAQQIAKFTGLSIAEIEKIETNQQP